MKDPVFFKKIVPLQGGEGLVILHQLMLPVVHLIHLFRVAYCFSLSVWVRIEKCANLYQVVSMFVCFLPLEYSDKLS